MRCSAKSLKAALGACVVGAFLLIPTGQAAADVFGPISLASESGREQVSFAHDAAISGNGRYVVFDGFNEGRHGIWRRDLASNVIERVTEGNAALPSISENGQYVSFTTSVPLAPNADKTEVTDVDVYVRNMAIGEDGQSSPSCEQEEHEEVVLPEYGQSCPFTLVSAVNGKSEGLTYEGLEGSSRYGSVASGRTAISADGRHVAFVTTAISNLLEPSEAVTPPMQVAVRDTVTRTTQLVSVRDQTDGSPAVNPETGGPETVLGGEGYDGAVYSDAGKVPPEFKVTEKYNLTPPLGASISADGSTVAWLAVNVSEQAKVLPAEFGLNPRYTEPLWRRIADGPTASTRRITGGSDPENPACLAAGEQDQPETNSNPCQGPFFVGVGTEPEPGIWKLGGSENFVPQLSSDGYTVAFLAQAPTLAREEGFARGLDNADLFVADMHGGLTRTEALQQLTELASGSGSDLATTASIVDFGLSPDGRQIAFSTQRTDFPLGVPAYVSAPMAVPGMSELFDVDLSDSTLTRVTQSLEGGPSEHPHQESGSGTTPYSQGDGALSPSFSDNGDLLAFSSTAANLVYGDGNTPPLVNGQLEKTEFDGSDAFVVARIPFVETPTESYVSSAPGLPRLGLEWRLGATAASLVDGRVRLYVTVPGAGRLSASAEGVIRVTNKSHGRSAGVRGKKRRSGTTSLLATRRVASTAKTVGAGGTVVQLTLTLAQSYKALADAKAGLPALVTVAFAAPGHHALTQTFTVTFKRKPPAKKRRASSKGVRR